MDFSYGDYIGLLRLLREQGYEIRGYHDYTDSERCVILRHDVDTSLDKALLMAELEAGEGVKSTYFVLLRTDFYNPASASAQQRIQKIAALGHEIGLHFDELAYPADVDVPTAIAKEAELLSGLCGFPIRSVSMHRPSKKTLESNYVLPGLVNSYGGEFFHGFKYLSDSRRRWREPVLDIVSDGSCNRLHILTHPFWYGEESLPMDRALDAFVRGAAEERYLQLKDNITDLSSVLPDSYTGAAGMKSESRGVL